MANNVRLIAELGSCHMGKIEYIKEAIDRCKDSGIDALKLQLFPDEAPYTPTNIYLHPTLFREAFDYGEKVGLPVSASVFNEALLLFLIDLKPQFIKLAFSKKDRANPLTSPWVKLIEEAKTELIVSCDVMTDRLVPKNATKLYCIPEYPVRYEVAFDGLFGFDYYPKQELDPIKLVPNFDVHGYEVHEFIKPIHVPGRFDGFSDHTLGIRQTKRAIEAGAKIIEKHVRLGKSDETCPDAQFAVLIEEFAKCRA